MHYYSPCAKRFRSVESLYGGQAPRASGVGPCGWCQPVHGVSCPQWPSAKARSRSVKIIRLCTINGPISASAAQKGSPTCDDSVSSYLGWNRRPCKCRCKDNRCARRPQTGQEETGMTCIEHAGKREPAPITLEKAGPQRSRG